MMMEGLMIDDSEWLDGRWWMDGCTDDGWVDDR